MTEPKTFSEKEETKEAPTDSQHRTKTDVVERTNITDAASAKATDTPSPSQVVQQQIPKKSRDDFNFVKFIGEGSFSTVFLAKEKTTQHEYAVKVCEKRHILRERKQEYVRREREVLQIMTNVAGFVKLMCTFQDRQSLYFAMTYAPNGELLPHIKRVGCFSVECARHYAAELVLACEQMHRRNVVHRDLKPENILLDRRMHTLIADFGSAKVLTAADIAAIQKSSADVNDVSDSSSNKNLTDKHADNRDDDDDESSDDLCSEPTIDDVDAFYRPQKSRRNRKGSFVGTPQYVSPEVLQNSAISPAADLWALGCILYQMISGVPPFRGHNDFAIFKKILACDTEFPEFPEHFDPKAEHLITQLLKLNPKQRLGALDDYNEKGYVSLRQHPFFENINFETIREQRPPKVQPYLLTCYNNNDASEAKSINTLESEMEKLLSLSSDQSEQFQSTGKFDLSSGEKQRVLEQQKTDKWHPFADNEVILKKGFVNKHKGLFGRKRMLLLTTGPHLITIDPVEMIKAGEIPWGPYLRAELGNSRVFFVHTEEPTHFFVVLEGNAQDWIAAIERVHRLTYKELSQAEQQQQPTSYKKRVL